MSTEREEVATTRVSPAVKRAAVYAALLLGVFLLGLIPMWLAARERGRERDQAQRALRLSQMQNQLATAALRARRGDYEPARQSASDFFNSARAEVDRGDASALGQAQRQAVTPLLAQRDELITLLARGDPASAERLSELFFTYHGAIEQPSR